MEGFQHIMDESIRIRTEMRDDLLLNQTLARVVDEMCRCFESGGKVLFCGNGGSAADAQHIAAELSGRFEKDREPLFAEALHVNTSFLTAVSNDYGYDEAFARLVKAMGRSGDVLFGLSTSGNSPNVVKAMEQARSQGMTTVAMVGESEGKLAGVSTHVIKVPSNQTARIQEAHITIGHHLCAEVERKMFPS